MKRIQATLWLLPALFSVAMAADPVTINAIRLCEVPRNSVTNNVCRLFRNDFATCAFRFPEAADFTFVVAARGDAADGCWPELNVRLDGKRIFRTKVSSIQWVAYTFDATISSGAHAVSLCFENGVCTNRKDQNIDFTGFTLLPRGRAAAPSPLSAAEYRQFLNDRNNLRVRMADERIEQIRKGNLTVKVVDARGAPVSNATVTVEQTRHEFLFGAEICASMFEPQATNSEAVSYRNNVRKYFNHAVVEKAMAWPEMEPVKDDVRYKLVDDIAEWCRTNRLSLRGHCLFWSCHLPEWAKALSDADLRFAVMRRARNVVGHYRGLINEFDACNELSHCAYLNNRLGDSFFRQMCAEAEGANPGVVLYVNDYGIFEGTDLNRYVEQIRKLREDGVAIGGIGIQTQLDGPIHLDRLQEALDALAKFNLPVKITEYGCSVNDETVQARTIEDVYRTAFAHPAVAGILMGGVWEKCHRRPTAAMLRADFSKKPSAETYERLVFSNWWTRAGGKTGRDGVYACRAFFGELSVKARTEAGVEVRKMATLKKAAGKAVVELQLVRAPAPEPQTELAPDTAEKGKPSESSTSEPKTNSASSKAEDKKPSESTKPEPDSAPFDYDVPVMR